MHWICSFEDIVKMKLAKLMAIILFLIDNPIYRQIHKEFLISLKVKIIEKFDNFQHILLFAVRATD